MILESLLVFLILGVILVFFYRQALKEFRILQTDSLEKAITLFSERSPTVILPFQYPVDLWTRKDLQQRPNLLSQLSGDLQEPSVWWSLEKARAIATDVGIPVWVQQTLLPTFQQSVWWGPILWAETKVSIGSQGLRPTFGYTTVLMVTEGAIQVSLVNESADPYLPKQWVGKRLTRLTRNEAPLLSQIQFIDVILRPGSALCIPPHWKVCWECIEEPKPALAVWIDIHHTVSYFTQKSFYARR